MVGRERCLFAKQTKSDYAGRYCLTYLRGIPKIFARPEQMVRERDANGFPGGGIAIGRRMGAWAADLSRLVGGLIPGREMANFFSAGIERGRAARPKLPPRPYRIHWRVALFTDERAKRAHTRPTESKLSDISQICW